MLYPYTNANGMIEIQEIHKSSRNRNKTAHHDNRLKAKVCEAIIRPALTYGSECWAMKVTNAINIATTEMRMLCGILGVSRRDHMRNAQIRRILHVSPIDVVVRRGRLRWFGHVQRRDANNVTLRVMNLAIPGTRRRGRQTKTDMAPTDQGRHDGPVCYPGCGPRPEGVETKDKADP